MIALITPTGARKEQFGLCAGWMKRQTYEKDVIWIIVDDALPVSTNIVQYDFRGKWTIYKVFPSPHWQGSNTQARNIKAGIDKLLSLPEYSKVKTIFIIEDDDYYKKEYLTEMVKRMGKYNLIGETNSIYYNVFWRQYADNNNKQHSSLFQSAFTPKSIPLFLNCLNTKFIDALFWAKEPNRHLFHAGTLSVGIKGMPGRGGIGAGHKKTMYFNQDQSYNYLPQLIGADAELYKRYYRDSGKPQYDILAKRGL